MLPNSAEYNAALSAKFTLPRNYLQAILANSFVSSSPKHLASPIKTYSSLKPTTSHCLGLYLPLHHTLTLVAVHKFQHLSLRETFPLTHANQLANNYLASSANQNAKTRGHQQFECGMPSLVAATSLVEGACCCFRCCCCSQTVFYNWCVFQATDCCQ